MLSLFHYEIVQNAFLGGTIIAIVAALIGYFVVLRAQAFAAEALTDIGFAGATGAAILGVGALIGMLFLTLLSALGMGALGERVRGRDIEIGMVLSFALGLGVLFLSLYTQNSALHATSGMGILFGSILSINRQDVWISLVCSCVILLALAMLFRPLLFASVDPEVAQARGVPVRLLSVAFLLLLGATAAEAVMVVGVLLVSALLIAPAATAERLTHRPLTALLLSVVLSLTFTWIGLILAFVGTGKHLPVGFYISALAALSYFGAVLVSRSRRAARRVRVVPCSKREERVPVAL